MTVYKPIANFVCVCVFSARFHCINVRKKWHHVQQFAVYSTAQQSNHLDLWAELMFQSKTFTLPNLLSVIHVYAQSNWWYESDSNALIVSSLVSNKQLFIRRFFIRHLFLFTFRVNVFKWIWALFIHCICAHFTEYCHFHRFLKGDFIHWYCQFHTF